MSNFKEYNKIHGLHKEECDGLLLGTVHIQEKIDGANASIWSEDGIVHCGSRTRDLTRAGDCFNGFVEYVANHVGIQRLMKDKPGFRLFGEWLVRHTIGYNETAYKKFYLFDIEGANGDLLEYDFMMAFAEEYGIDTAYYHGKFDNPTLDQIKELAGKSVLGQKGEGVVVKRLDFVNKFGRQQHGKYVTQDFKEDNAITFGGNNKSSETYNEMYYVNKFLGLERVRKNCQKLEAMEGRLEMKHVPRIMEMTYYDLITEECWTIAKEMEKSGKFFDFKSFKEFCYKKTKKIFVEILENFSGYGVKDIFAVDR